MCTGNDPLEVPAKSVGANSGLHCVEPPMDLNESPIVLQSSSHDNVNIAKPFGQVTQHKTCLGPSPHSAMPLGAHS